MESHELGCESPCSYDCDLLAEDGADCCFEAVPTAGSAETGALRNQGSEHRVAGEMVVDSFDVGAEVEEAADASDDGG